MKQFVIIMGGAGSGKNYFIEQDTELSHYVLVDVDEVKKHMDLSAAIASIKPTLETHFKAGHNVVHPTTGSNLSGQKTKIALAKKYGYSVTLLFKDTDAKQALKNVEKRVQKGEHAVAEHDIITSNQKARSNFDKLKSLADSSKIV